MEAFLAEDFLAGLSTRDLARISGKHLGHRYDSKQISRIVGRATTELEAWRRRSLLQGQRYKFLYVDGANFRVRINGHVARQSFCGVLGVSEENERFEVLALEMGDREQADLWASLLGDLAERGLNLEAVELGIMDGLPGLEAVFQRFFPRAQTFPVRSDVLDGVAHHQSHRATQQRIQTPNQCHGSDGRRNLNLSLFWAQMGQIGDAEA